METRWLFLGFGLLFGSLLVVHLSRGNHLLVPHAVVLTIFGLGGFWWNTTRDDPIRTRFSQSR
jgi:hypothetical protein